MNVQFLVLPKLFRLVVELALNALLMPTVLVSLDLSPAVRQSILTGLTETEPIICHPTTHVFCQEVSHARITNNAQSEIHATLALA